MRYGHADAGHPFEDVVLVQAISEGPRPANHPSQDLDGEMAVARKTRRVGGHDLLDLLVIQLEKEGQAPDRTSQRAARTDLLRQYLDRVAPSARSMTTLSAPLRTVKNTVSPVVRAKRRSIGALISFRLKCMLEASPSS